MASKVEIVLSATGAAAVAAVFKDLADKGEAFQKSVTAGGSKSQAALNALGAESQNVAGGFKLMESSWLRFAVLFAGGNLIASSLQQIAQQARDLVVESSRLGREQQLQEATFKSFATSVGVAGEVLAAQIDKVAGGIIDSGDAMKIAMRGLAAGLQPEQIVTLTDAARQLAKSLGVDTVEAYQSLTEAIATGRSRRLQEINVIVDMESALESYAVSIGKTVKELDTAGRTHALYIATMQAAGPVIESNRKVNDEFGDSMARLKIAWNDVKETVGVFLNDTAVAIIRWLGQVRADIGDITPSLTELGVVWAATWTNAKATLEPFAVALDGVKGIVNGVMVAGAELGLLFNFVFKEMVGPITFVSLLLADLANKRLPDMAAHGAAVGAAMATANKEYEASIKALHALRDGFKDGVASADEFGQGWGRATGKLNAGRNALGEMSKQIKALPPDLKAVAAEAERAALALAKLTLDKASKILDEGEILFTKSSGFDVTATIAELDALSVTLGENAAEVKNGTEAWHAKEAAIEAAALAYEQLLEIMQGELARTLAEATQAEIDDAEAWKALGIAWRDAEKMSQVLGGAFDLTSAKIALQTQELQLLIKEGWDPLGPKVQQALDKLNAFKAQAFEETLAKITLQGRLLGPTFDTVAPTISAVTAEIVRLGEAGQDVTALQEKLAGLQEKLAGLRQFEDLKGMFHDIFSSFSRAFSTSVQGVIMGTTTMADAFKRMGQSVLLTLLDTIINRGLKVLANAVWDFVAGLFGSGGGSGGGNVLAAIGSWISQAFGGGGGGGGSTTVSAGVSSPGVLAANGFSNATGGLGGFTTALQFASGGANTFSNVLTGISQGWSAGAGISGGVSGAISGGWSAWQTAYSSLSGFSLVLGYAAAAIQGFTIIMDENKSDIGKAIQTATLAAGIALAGPTFGISLIVAPLINWLEDLFGLFGTGPSAYDLKRIKAADEANQALGSVAGGYQNALNTGDIAQILAALQGGGGGASGNSVRTELVLPSNLAAQMGITGQQIGDQIVAQWSSLTLDQFQQVIAAFKEQPDLIQLIRGSGDVPYLEGQDAAAIAEQIRQGAIALITAFEAMQEVRDKITQLAVDLGEAGASILPPAIADAFANNIVNPIRDRMLAVLSSGLPVEEMQKQLTALEKELQSWTGLVSLYGQLTQDMALLSRDLQGQTAGAVLGIEMMMDAADKAVAAALTRAGKAVGPEEQLAANTALREAILGRYQMEMEMIARIQASTAQLQEASAVVQGTLTGLAVVDLAGGDATAFNEIYLALADMAMVAPTAVERLFAVGAGIAAVLAALPTSAGFFANGSSLYGARTPLGAETSPGVFGAPQAIPDQIVAQLAANVAPFFAALGDLIQDAVDTGDLAGQLSLLQQQAELIKAVGAAAVQAVKDWATAAIDATRTAADAMRADINKNWDAYIDAVNATADAEIAALELARDTRVTGLEAEIKVIETATKARQTAIDLEIKGLNAQQEGLREQHDLAQQAIDVQRSALQEQIAVAREWEGVVESVADTIRQIKLGPMGGGNPADKLTLAKDEWKTALAAFNANPTAAGAGDVQRAAQDLLKAGIDVYTKPNPLYQGLAESVTQALEGIKSQAAGMAPVSAADLEAQTAALDAQSKTLADTFAAESKGIADRIELLNEESHLLGEKASAQIDLLREQIDTAKKDAADQIKIIDDTRKAVIDQAEKSRDHDLDLVDLWEAAQIAAIEATAQTTIDGISAGVAAALRANAAEQIAVLGTLKASLDAQLAAIIGDQTVQEFMASQAAETVRLLGLIQADIGGLIAGGAPALASGSDRVRGGYHLLHDDEAVLPKDIAEIWRASGGMRGIRSAAEGAGLRWQDRERGPRLPESQLPFTAEGTPQWNDPLYDAVYRLWMVQGARVRADLVYQRAALYREQGRGGGGVPEQRLDVFNAMVESAVAAWRASMPVPPPPRVASPTSPPGSPPGTPPVAPSPSTVPPWLRPDTASQAGGTGGSAGGAFAGGQAAGGGDLTVILQVDGKQLGKAVMPAVLTSARREALRTVILETKPG